MTLLKRVSSIRGLDWPRAFSFFYPLALYCCLIVLAFNVSTVFDKVAAGLMALSFLLSLRAWARDYPKQSPEARRLGGKSHYLVIFRSARALYIAFAAYLLWDVAILLYSRDLLLALRKLPYYVEYFFLFVGGVWYCRDQGRLLRLMAVIASAGSTVAAFTYFYYFLGRRPYYFQRMSTCRDYNVYSALLFVSLVFVVILIMNGKRFCWWKRLLFLALVLAVNLPAFYLAGSRRMVILLPFFYLFLLLYEGLRVIRNRREWIKRLVMLLLCGVLYAGCALLKEPFAAYGEQKRRAYNEWKLSRAEEETPGEETQLEETPKESTLSEVMETIENGSMSNKRHLIYTSGLKELFGYSLLEWVLGRGAAYDLFYYSHTNDEELLTAYGYSLENRPARGWMSAHNFLLADLMNGGLIKLCLGLFLVGVVFFEAVRACKRRPDWGGALILPLALAICNACISGAFGLLNDVFFMIMLAYIGGVLAASDVQPGGKAGNGK